MLSLVLRKTSGKPTRGRRTPVAHGYSSSVLAPVSCVGEVLGWHCGSDPVVLDLPACDTGKSLRSTRPWCSTLAGLIPGLHVLAGQLPFGSKTPSSSPTEGPVRVIPGGYS